MMMQQPKLVLSQKELEALGDREFLLLKRNVTDKLLRELNEVKLAVKSSTAFSSINFPEGTDMWVGKISKGENYLGLPYLVLDFPKLFSKKEVLAFRTMIWWGRLVSCTLLKSVEDKGEVRRITERLRAMKNKNVWICIHESPWHHHFGLDNYVKLESLRAEEVIACVSRSGFIKLARKIPIRQISRMRSFAQETFELFSAIL